MCMCQLFLYFTLAHTIHCVKVKSFQIELCSRYYYLFVCTLVDMTCVKLSGKETRNVLACDEKQSNCCQNKKEIILEAIECV